MMEENEEAARIRQEIFSFLSQASDPQSVKMKEIRNHLELQLNYSKGTFKTEQYKEYLEAFAVEYFENLNRRQRPTRTPIQPPSSSSLSSSIRQSSAGRVPPIQPPIQQSFKTIGMDQITLPEGGIAWKSGKFSVSEKNLIFQTVQKYVAEKEISLQDLHPHYRAEGEIKRFPELYERLQTLLPNRKRQALKDQVLRLVLRQDHFEKFTEADIERLRELVNEHGRNFSKIGKIMGKPGEDCKHIFYDLDKVNKGKFTLEEDNQILKAVIEVMNVQVPPLPNTRIPWKAVAEKLDNYRHPDDYCRRWPIILSIYRSQESLRDAADPIVIRSDVNLEWYQMTHSQLERDKTMMRLLTALLESGANDETEVVWSDLDRHLQISGSDMMYRRAERKHFQTAMTDLLFPERVELLLEKYQQSIDIGQATLQQQQQQQQQHNIDTSMESLNDSDDESSSSSSSSSSRSSSDSEGESESSSGDESDNDSSDSESSGSDNTRIKEPLPKDNTGFIDLETNKKSQLAETEVEEEDDDEPTLDVFQQSNSSSNKRKKKTALQNIPPAKKKK